MTATKSDRTTAWAQTLEALGRRRVAEVLAMRVTWHQPDRRARDDDNLVASFKVYRDGIALALGIDDRTFRPVHMPDGEIRRGGAVAVEIDVVLR